MLMEQGNDDGSVSTVADFLRVRDDSRNVAHKARIVAYANEGPFPEDIDIQLSYVANYKIEEGALTAMGVWLTVDEAEDFANLLLYMVSKKREGEFG